MTLYGQKTPISNQNASKNTDYLKSEHIQIFNNVSLN